jgi:N-ethylmaleimide reductase
MNQEHPHLFSPYQMGQLHLKNRIVMAPMTRSRAVGNEANDLMATYYAQRATAGLIITEGTAPAPDGLGYARIPGLYNDAQVAAWKKVTDAVHEKGGKIFVQIMHTGRIAHPANLPAGARVVAPSAIPAANSPMWTDTEGMQPLPVPEALSTGALLQVKEQFVHSARCAIAAGFDGVELHAANGYLLEQFLNPASNQRDDQYGGSPEARNRFVLEVAQAVADAIGGDKTGIRVSPYGVFNEMIQDADTDRQYLALAKGLRAIGLVYLHLVDHATMGTPPVPDTIKAELRAAFGSTFILSGGYDANRAEADLTADKGELVAFGRPFIANPDLVQRLATGAPLQAPDASRFYTPGEEGYSDYPTLAQQALHKEPAA